MSSPLSPDQYGGNASQSSPDGGPSSGQDKSSTSGLNLNFFKSLSDKKTTREGNTPKRRGPKPDSKPALTRRQELNRQAQRTHRERKELYIKALEEEVLRLKQTYSNVSQDKDKLAEENRQLKEALAQNGIHHPRSTGMEDVVSNPSIGPPSSTSLSGTNFGQDTHSTFSPPVTSKSTAASVSSAGQSGHQPMTGQQLRNLSQQSPGGRGGDLEQAGIDFVLTLEKPCMHHIPFLLDRASETGGEPCGHALMASCPPVPFSDLTAAVPFGHKHTQDEQGPNPSQGTWELSKGDLATLLDLSAEINLDGEITPVMAWGMILNHPSIAGLQSVDFQKLAEELGRKVRCYGFGAVMEEFEVRDAFECVLSPDSDAMAY